MTLCLLFKRHWGRVRIYGAYGYSGWRVPREVLMGLTEKIIKKQKRKRVKKVESRTSEKAEILIEQLEPAYKPEDVRRVYPFTSELVRALQSLNILPGEKRKASPVEIRENLLVWREIESRLAPAVEEDNMEGLRRAVEELRAELKEAQEREAREIDDLLILCLEEE